MSRADALARGRQLLLVGGLTRGDVSTAAIWTIDPASGSERRTGSLLAAVHDAGGALLHGTPYVFGGGSATSTTLVQRAGGSATRAGRLPAPRSDLAAVSVGNAAYLVGGYDGQRWSATVLRTRDGRHFTVAARLPVPVRYAAVAVANGELWVVGGLTASGTTNVIQRVDPRSGRAGVVGRLPVRLAGASALVLDGQLLVCGGVSGRVPHAAIYRVSAGAVHQVGRLARPVGYAAGVVVRGVGYILGGETPRLSREVEVVRMSASRSPGATP